jgi:uncharacterized protein DUF1194
MAELVDLALVLAVDVSGSVSQDRLRLQRRGYEAAFRSPDLIGAVKTGRRGRMAATFVEWAEADRQSQAVPWAVIASDADAQRFADAIAASLVPNPGWTSISGAIDRAVALIQSSGISAERRVIDISSDGPNNDGRLVTAARDDALAAGITINGLPILEVDPGLDTYYRQNVIGGPLAFLMPARDINSFANALMRKLLVEVAAVR